MRVLRLVQRHFLTFEVFYNDFSERARTIAANPVALGGFMTGARRSSSYWEISPI
jgi:hypothetical protein